MAETDPWDEYFIPGTTVLRNLVDVDDAHPHGTTDAARLADFEARVTLIRMTELAGRTDVRAETFDDMKAIHRHIFSDVYPFAGEQRTAPVGRPMYKQGVDVVNFAPDDPARFNAPMINYPYRPAEVITRAAAKEFGLLAEANFLRGLPEREFVPALAERWGRINYVHPFREGNTRTQFIFFAKLAERAGYRLNTSLFENGAPLRSEFVTARFYEQATGDPSRLTTVLGKGIKPLDSDRGPTAEEVANLFRAAFPSPAREIPNQGRQAPKPAPEQERESGPEAGLGKRPKGLEGRGSAGPEL